MKKLTFKKISFDPITFDATRDWKRLFFFFVGLILIFILWNGYVFWTVETGQAAEVQDGGTPPASASLPKTGDITAIKAAEDAKAALYKKALAGSSPLSDPSK